MKDIISYFYDIQIKNIIDYNDKSVINTTKNELLIFKQILDEDNLVDVIKIISMNNHFFKILFNKKNDLFSKINDKKYILFSLSNPTFISNLNFNYYFVEFHQDLVPSIWENKINYYKKKIADIGINDDNIVNLFNYYIGCAENALSIYNYSLNKDNSSIRYCVCRKRIFNPNYNLFYNDPTNFLVDSVSRELSEYIKAKFFYDNISSDDAINLYNNSNLTEDETTIFFARLMYPSYFFDCLESGNKNKCNYNLFIKKMSSYQHLLKEIKIKLKKNQFILNINWI